MTGDETVTDDLVVRRLTLDDLDLLLQVPPGVFDHPVDPVQAQAFLRDPAHEMVLACIGDVVVGMASAVVHLHPDKGPQLFVNEVGVHEDRRRLGIGRRLVRELRDVAEKRGCNGIWLATESDNEAARGLYRAAGARETDGIVVYDWDAEL